MTPPEEWDGPIQAAIRAWDAKQGHQPVTWVGFFQPPQRPNGGTVFLRPAEESGNPYASLDEVPARYVDVELPVFEEGDSDADGR